jgi:hypothetical protein
MKSICLVAAMALSALSPTLSRADVENFDKTTMGALPDGWMAGVTGTGSPKWAVIADPSAPSSPNVLNQSGTGTYPWAVKRDVVLGDGYVQTKFKAISGKEDQAAGVVWRWKNSNTYYVARANANENNVSLYYTTNGTRNTIKYVSAPVPRGVWHTLRVEFEGTKIRVALNGKVCIEADDAHIQGNGAVGVWTKSNSVTSFDDFNFGQR